MSYIFSSLINIYESFNIHVVEFSIYRERETGMGVKKSEREKRERVCDQGGQHGKRFQALPILYSWHCKQCV